MLVSWHTLDGQLCLKSKLGADVYVGLNARAPLSSLEIEGRRAIAREAATSTRPSTEGAAKVVSAVELAQEEGDKEHETLNTDEGRREKG